MGWMVKSVNDEILNATIRHQVYLQRHTTAVVNKSVALLNQSEARLLAQLLKAEITEFSKERLTRLLKQIRKIRKTAYEPVISDMKGAGANLAEYEAEFQTDMVTRIVPVNLDLITPSPAQLNAAVRARPFLGRFLKDWYKDIVANDFTRLKNAIRLGYTEGRTTDQIVRDIRGTKKLGYKDGIINRSRRGVEATVRTSLNHTANVARNEVYKSNEKYIKGVQWVSTLDGKTTLVCMGRDGKMYPVDSGPRPPADIGCRSTMIPVIRSAKELGLSKYLKDDVQESTRASMNGQIAGKTDYSDFLRNESRSFQDDVLGVKKAKLFRDGNLHVDRFTDTKGRSYTLDELRKREPEAWKATGF